MKEIYVLRDLDIIPKEAVVLCAFRTYAEADKALLNLPHSKAYIQKLDAIAYTKELFKYYFEEEGCVVDPYITGDDTVEFWTEYAKYEFNPFTSEWRHCGYGAGCFWTDWA